MTRNRIFHFVMACVWIYTFYLLMHMQDMLAMYVMAGGMFAQSGYSVIFDQKGC